MSLSLIVALAKNRAIGKDNKLLWHLSDDLKNFKKISSGKTVIMGRKTYESIGFPLPNRRNIVISRNESLSYEGVELVNSLEAALALAEEGETLIIGGASIYEESLDIVDKMYITYVDFTPENADVFFPDFSIDEWSVVRSFDCPKNDKNDHAWTFVEYTRNP